jgi:cell fate regulator YaaT (PSP1 superfamily)
MPRGISYKSFIHSVILYFAEEGRIDFRQALAFLSGQNTEN